MKRITLFVFTNLAVLVVMSITVNILGLNRYVQESGFNMTTLLLFAAVFGMGGAFISLFISKSMAKRSTGAHIIQQPANQAERWLFQIVQVQAQAAGIGMPEVAIYDSPAPNAFATGANRNNALVAVSTGLLQHMSQDEVEAVLAHEVSHVANGDMVTLTLVQGVVNTFVIVLARIVGMMVDRALSGNQQQYRGPGIGFWVTSMIAEVLLGFLATMIVMWFSRQREFRADAGGAQLAGRQKMIAALQRLQQGAMPSQLPSEMAAFGITGGLGQGLKKLFLSHPPLEQRIAALRSGG